MSNWLKYYKAGITHDREPEKTSVRGEEINIRSAFKQLVPFIKPHWRIGLVSASLVFLASLMAFPLPLINRFLVDDVILARRMDQLPWAILLLGGFKLLDMGIEMLQDYYQAYFSQSVILDVQKALLDHLLDLPKAFFDKKEVGYLISRISSDVTGLRWFFSNTIAYLFTNLVKFIGGLAFLFYLEWRLALVSVVILPALLLRVRYFSKHLRILSHHSMEQYAVIVKRLQETIASIPLIKAFSTEQDESERVVAAIEGGRQLTMEQAVVSSVANRAINTAPDITKAIVLIVGAYLAIQGEWTLGSLLAFQSYLSYVLGPAMFFAQANFSLQNSMASLERVMGLFNIIPEDNLESGMEVDKLKGEITFKNVTFGYAGDQPILQDLNFQIQPGEHVAIVGPSGVGKTTLVSLILCFYQPNQGEILFDDLPVSDYHLPSLRRRIGYVSQSTLLLSGTFRDNLRYGHPEATQQELENACQAAGIHEFIANVPMGYDALIDERGANLSEGQKQRLSIARALIKNPDILLLDEPTAALDSIVERAIFDSLPQFIQGKTLFVVAHRLATIQNSDRILLLSGNRLVGMGTHHQLLTDSAYYRELVANQAVLGS